MDKSIKTPIENDTTSEYDREEEDRKRKEEEKERKRQEEKDKLSKYTSSGLSYSAGEKDGKWMAKGSDGSILEGRNFAELNDKVLTNMKKSQLSENKEPGVAFDGPQECCKIFAEAAILKHKMVVKGGWPEDPNFWKNLKKEFMNNKSNSMEEWVRLTRRVPDEFLQRTPEEKALTQKSLMIDKKLQDLKDRVAPKKEITPTQPIISRTLQTRTSRSSR